MKEITILSGKGGTGKTSISAALASLSKNAVFCDNDVDAADLHLLLQPEIKEKNVFHSGWDIKIDHETCTVCKICMNNCRFDAIHHDKTGKIQVNPFQCEGCRLCERICPEQAISAIKKENNFWFVSDTRFGPLVHAKMGPGEENSGKLVTAVRKKAKEIAEKSQADFIISDGPPGIGCAAIASITGTGYILLVTEPSKSALHDAERLVDLIRTFDIPIAAIINKADINEELSNSIEGFLEKNQIPLLAKIPFDKTFVESMINQKTITEFKTDSETSKILNDVHSLITS
jgi:MinD superfamily P-loop ATPase